MISRRENILKFYHHECPDFFPDLRRDIATIPLSYMKYESRPFPNESGYDGYGVYWQYEPINRASMPMPDPKTGKFLMEADDIVNWRDFIHFPDPDTFDWEAHVEEDMKGIDCENMLVSASVGQGCYEKLHAFMGVSEAAICLVEYPEETADFFNALCDLRCRTIRKVVQYYPKCDMIQMSDDYGHSTDAFFSPETYCKLFKPVLEKIVNTCKELGIMYELHSCGKWEKLMPYVVEAGLDHWTSSQALNDIESIVKKYGKNLTMIGGCDVKDIQKPGITLEKMREIVGARIDVVCKGGCVMPFGNSSTPNFRQAVEAEVAARPDFFQKPENRVIPE